MCDRAVGYKDSRARAYAESDNGSVLGLEIAENGFELGEELEQP